MIKALYISNYTGMNISIITVTDQKMYEADFIHIDPMSACLLNELQIKSCVETSKAKARV